MLARLQVDGFKTFEQLDVEFQPFTVVPGSNAAGKSNLFDALQLLSNSADRDVNEALRHLRGEPSELFRTTADGAASRISLAAEVLVDPIVVDSYGSRVVLKHTRIRYEVVLERREIRPNVPRIHVVEERVFPIAASEDTWAISRCSSEE